jgi:hypothetical protein
LPFTNGSLLGQFYSQTGTLAGAWASSNPTNPNEVVGPRNIFDIAAPGNINLLSVGPSGTVSVPGFATHHIGAMLGAFLLTPTQYAALPANPTAAQICQVFNPVNFAGQQLDIFQIAGPGNKVIFRLTYNGIGATS